MLRTLGRLRRPLRFSKNHQSSLRSYAQTKKEFQDVIDPELDKYSLPLVEKAKSFLFARISGTFTSVNWANIERTEPIYGSVMPYILHERWYANPIIGIRKDEPHEINLNDCTNSALQIYPIIPSHLSVRTVPVPKMNLTGTTTPIEGEDDIQLILDTYDKVHPGSVQFLKDRDIFKFYQFSVTAAHFVSSSGNLKSFEGDEFRAAKEDPIAPRSRPLINMANSTYAKQIAALCSNESDGYILEEAFIFALDTKGFDIMGKGPDGNWTQFRMPLDQALTNIEDYESTLVQTLKNTKITEKA